MNGVGRGDNKENKAKNTLLSRETLGMTLLLFSVIVFFIAVTGPYVFGDIGVAITSFFVGMFGFFVYPLLILAIYYSIVLISGKKRVPSQWILKITVLLLDIFFIVHTATAERFYGDGYGNYLGGCWSAASESLSGGTGGGVILGLVAYPIRALLSAAGAYVIYSLLLAGILFWIAMATPLRGIVFRRSSSARRRPAEEEEPSAVSYEDIPVPERNAALPQDRPAAAAAAPVYAEQQPAAVRPSAYDNARPASYPATADPSARAAQTANAAPAPKTSAEEQYQRSREILFQPDRASNYRNNLIYDRDSRFNTYPRRSSVVPVQQESGSTTDTSKSSSVASPASYSDGYTAAYTAKTEETRPSMPRRVTVERPAADAVENDFNYPQSPSYRAPAQPAAEDHDFYANDVPFEETYSSEPNVNDFETPAEPARPSYTAPAEPARRSYTAPAEPARPSYTAPAEPVRPSYTASAEPARPSSTAPAEKTAKPAEEKREELPPMTREEFRSVFSRPVEERTRIVDTASRTERFNVSEEDKPSRGDRFGTTENEGTPLRSERFGTDAEEKPSRSDRFAGEDKPSRGDRFTAADETPRGRRFSEPTDADVTSESSRFGGDEEELTSESRVYDAPVSGSAANLFDDAEIDDADYREVTAEPPKPERAVRTGRSMERPLTDRPAPASRGAREQIGAAAEDNEPAPAPQKHVYKAYVRPAITNLATYQETSSVSQEEIEQNSAIIVETLGGFRVEAEVVKVTVGSAVTRYDIDIPRNVTVSAVIKRDAEIAMRLHARDGVNIYSNSEAGAISIEVPNSRRATVGLKSVMQADEYVNAKPNALAFAIGKDVEGRNVCGNIVKMKHLLVAGSTGSGKSVCLNSMLISLICKYSPEELRLILIDPKKVEFAVFDGLPHLMINEIIADAQKAVSALNWAIKEMERRYSLFEKKTRSGVNVHNLDEYNASLTEDEERLAKIVIVVDELADLMSVAKKEIEDRIQRLAQKARAAGMHLVIATQRPSVDVITGVIKGNLPTRLAFRVIQEVDSRTILDESGAQKLLGNGDMLYRTEGMFNCLRVQGAFVGSEEVQKIVEDIKMHNEAYFDESVADFINRAEGSPAGGGDDADDGAVDPQYIKALAIVVKLGQASISLIQRKCSVGYNHAGKIIEWMELMGYISAFDGKAKARTVLLSKEDFEAKYGDLD